MRQGVEIAQLIDLIQSECITNRTKKGLENHFMSQDVTNQAEVRRWRV